MGTSDSDARKILQIDDIGKAFLDTDAVRKLPCQVYNSAPDAVDAAVENDFAAVAVVMSGSSSRLSSTLRTLRQVNSGAKIVLLVQMYEEPLAIQLIGLVSNGSPIADDYLICPTTASRFYEAAMSPRGGRAVETVAPSLLGAGVEMKIRQLEKLATEDDLTGLKNRRYIWEFSRQIIDHAKKENGRVTLLLFDIDNLKSYNDVYGHLAGDEVLKQVAVLMHASCRQHDVVGRIGGDEFAVVFWDGPQAEPAGTETERRSATEEHPKDAIVIAKRFRNELQKAELHLLGPQGTGVLTISGGLASFPRDGSTIQELFRQADRALLEAKRGGKNKIYLVGEPQSDIADIE
jgi:diguanylate cyclase (GGDEF)-like protein